MNSTIWSKRFFSAEKSYRISAVLLSLSSERSTADGGSGVRERVQCPGDVAGAGGTTAERSHYRLPADVRVGVGAPAAGPAERQRSTARCHHEDDVWIGAVVRDRRSGHVDRL